MRVARDFPESSVYSMGPFEGDANTFIQQCEKEAITNAWRFITPLSASIAQHIRESPELFRYQVFPLVLLNQSSFFRIPSFKQMKCKQPSMSIQHVMCFPTHSLRLFICLRLFCYRSLMSSSFWIPLALRLFRSFTNRNPSASGVSLCIGLTIIPPCCSKTIRKHGKLC